MEYKCSICSEEATGTFWVAYHYSLEICQAEILCEKCAGDQAEWWYFSGGKPRPSGFIPNFYSNDIEDVFDFFVEHGLAD